MFRLRVGMIWHAGLFPSPRLCRRTGACLPAIKRLALPVALKDPNDLLKGEGQLPLAAIDANSDEGRHILRAARRILSNLGKADAQAVSIEDTIDTTDVFASTRFNGDGVVPPASAEDDGLAKAIADIMACVGAVPDRSGADGLSQELCDHFFREARAYVTWYEEAEAEAQQTLPLGEETEAAAEAFDSVKTKIDDFFTRTSLAEYDRSAIGPLNPSETDYMAVAGKELSAQTAEVAAFPLARVNPEGALPLVAGINPAWEAALADFRATVVRPLLGDLDELTGAQWQNISSLFAAHAAWMERMRGAACHPLGIARVRELLAGDAQQGIGALIEQDKELEGEANAIAAVDRLVHYYAYLRTLLNNFVSLEDFYTPGKRAIFQAGTLYIDGRSCELCVEVEDIAAHSALATLSRT